MQRQRALRKNRGTALHVSLAESLFCKVQVKGKGKDSKEGLKEAGSVLDWLPFLSQKGEK